MRIEYRLRYFDVLSYQLLHAFMSPVVNGAYLIFTAFIFSSELGEQSLAMSSAMAATSYLLMWVAQAVFTALYFLRGGEDGVLTHHVIEVREDGLFEATRFNETRQFWPGVFKVARRPGFVGVYVAQHVAHIIPNRAFRSRDERRRFVQLVRERMSAAQRVAPTDRHGEP